MSLVSVIIPSFNRREVLERALNSVVAQSFRDWDLTLVDDGSTDNTELFFRQWKDRQNLTQNLHFIRSENRGVSHARNLGMQSSSAPWIAFLDSDDEWLPSKLERQLQLRENFSLIHGEEIWIRRGTRVNPMKKHAKAGGRIFSRCVELCCISPSTALLRRELVNEVGLFREDFLVCEDYELWLRICSRYEVGFVLEPVIIKYGGHSDQLSLRFKAMDYNRVKALVPFLEHKQNLSPQEYQHLTEAVIAKCQILLKGYEKYNQRENEHEVQAWLERALSLRTQYNNAHSTAERLPRSLSILTL